MVLYLTIVNQKKKLCNRFEQAGIWGEPPVKLYRPVFDPDLAARIMQLTG